jgi:hypothetical protein
MVLQIPDTASRHPSYCLDEKHLTSFSGTNKHSSTLLAETACVLFLVNLQSFQIYPVFICAPSSISLTETGQKTYASA